MLVGENLALHVASLIQVAFHKAFAPAEGRESLTGGGFVKVPDLLHRVGNFHTASAATEGGFNGDRQPILLSEGDDLVGIFDGFFRAGGHWGFGTQRDVTGGDLVAQVADGLGGGANPGQTCVNNGLGKVAVFGQEAVTRVDSISAGLLCGIKDLVKYQVRLRRVLAAKGESFVRHRDERCVCIWFCVNGDAGDARIARSTNNANRDFTTVRHENLGDLLEFDGH